MSRRVDEPAHPGQNGGQLASASQSIDSDCRRYSLAAAPLYFECDFAHRILKRLDATEEFPNRD
jgi:hypothetical protein